MRRDTWSSQVSGLDPSEFGSRVREHASTNTAHALLYNKLSSPQGCKARRDHNPKSHTLAVQIELHVARLVHSEAQRLGLELAHGLARQTHSPRDFSGRPKYSQDASGAQQHRPSPRYPSRLLYLTPCWRSDHLRLCATRPRS